jgi:hypothetical protein
MHLPPLCMQALSLGYSTAWVNRAGANLLRQALDDPVLRVGRPPNEQVKSIGFWLNVLKFNHTRVGRQLHRLPTRNETYIFPNGGQTKRRLPTLRKAQKSPTALTFGLFLAYVRPSTITRLLLMPKRQDEYSPLRAEPWTGSAACFRLTASHSADHIPVSTLRQPTRMPILGAPALRNLPPEPSSAGFPRRSERNHDRLIFRQNSVFQPQKSQTA